MKRRYRLICRGLRGGTCYCVDSKTGKRTSLGKLTADEAQEVVNAKNHAKRQPMLNLQLSKAYLSATDAETSSRTWAQALDTLTHTKQEANKKRWLTVAKDSALADLLPRSSSRPWVKCCSRPFARERFRPTSSFGDCTIFVWI